MEELSRLEILIGKDAIEKLRKARIAVFGIGGVGGYVVEALARSGIGNLDLIDNDDVCLSNINRQIIALHSNIGQYKVDVAKARILDINSQCIVTTHKMFYLPDNADEIDLSCYSYVIDCIDTVTAKLELIRRCCLLDVPVISSMGTGNKLDPSQMQVCTLDKTDIDPLAKVMRRTLRKEGITHIKVVSSKEMPLKPRQDDEPEMQPGSSRKRAIPGSIAFVPATAGLLAAAEVIKDLIKA